MLLFHPQMLHGKSGQDLFCSECPRFSWLSAPRATRVHSQELFLASAKQPKFPQVPLPCYLSTDSKGAEARSFALDSNQNQFYSALLCSLWKTFLFSIVKHNCWEQTHTCRYRYIIYLSIIYCNSCVVGCRCFLGGPWCQTRVLQCSFGI